jgi:hypothetical protein
MISGDLLITVFKTCTARRPSERPSKWSAGETVITSSVPAEPQQKYVGFATPADMSLQQPNRTSAQPQDRQGTWA